MQQFRENYLSVTYEINKGLNFKWNFKDLFQYTNYFHHLLVIRTHDAEQALEFLTAYYKKLKSGDLLSVIYYDGKRNKVARLTWIERSPVNSYDFSRLARRISSEPISQAVKSQMMMMAGELTSSESQHYVTGFLMEQGFPEQQDDFRKIIEDARSKGSFNYICSFFGPYRSNNISFSDGINFFTSDKKELTRTLQFFYTHINNAAIKLANIVVEFTNGQLMCLHSSVWNNVDFNKLEKRFYGPSVSYTEDELHFHINEAIFNSQIELVISLEVCLFSGQVLRNCKKIKLFVPSQKYLDKSINMAMFDSSTFIEGLRMACNPYNSFSVVKVIRT